MEHPFAKDSQGAKNFYLCLQIAHTLWQVFECLLGGKKQVIRPWS